MSINMTLTHGFLRPILEGYQHKAFSYFTDEKIGTATCPKSHSKLAADMEIETLFPMP